MKAKGKYLGRGRRALGKCVCGEGEEMAEGNAKGTIVNTVERDMFW